MPRGKPSPKLAIIMNPRVLEEVMATAERDQVSVSTWMTNAAREALQRRAGLAAIEEWENEHGLFSPEEMVEARRRVRSQMRTSRKAQHPA